MERSQQRPRMVGALIGALAALAFAGAGLAWAQEAPSTTTPPATEAPAPDGEERPGHWCDRDGQGGNAPVADATEL